MILLCQLIYEASLPQGSFFRSGNLVSLTFRNTDETTFKKLVNKIKKLASNKKIPSFTNQGPYLGPNSKNAYIIKWEGSWPKKDDKQNFQALKSANIDFTIKSNLTKDDGIGYHASSVYKAYLKKIINLFDKNFSDSSIQFLDLNTVGFKY